MQVDDSSMSFLKQNSVQEEKELQDAWKILVVDDDDDVHSVTELVMHGVRILGKPLQFLHAQSAAEAKQILIVQDDVAVILLDVVMESENAGLALVQIIRDELKLSATRIILRTGQPGYAPEYEAIRDYDINDYRTKSELSYARLLTSLTSAIRSYVQLRTITDSSRLLEHIIKSAPDLLSRNSFEEYESGLMELLPGILAQSFDCVLVHRENAVDANGAVSYRNMIKSGFGKYADCQEFVLNAVFEDEGQLLSPPLSALLAKASQEKDNQFGTTGFVLLLPGFEHGDLLLAVELGREIDFDKKRLLEVFGVAITMGYQNVNLIAQLRSLAFKDGLTGLLNRTGFLQALNHVRRVAIPKQAIGLVDIEGFSELNEVLGHDYGDALLKAVADRLSTCFDEPVVCARVSGDGFCLLGKEESLKPDIIMAVFSKPFVIQQHSMYLRVVAGFVRIDEVEGDGADLLKDAYLAVKIAKMRKQTRYFYYTSNIEKENRQKIVLLEDLQRALEGGVLTVFYQPQVIMNSGAVTGLEALIRWKLPNGSYVPPSDFIPLAEQSGLIVDIGDWMFHQVCKQIQVWNAQGLNHFRVAVNISVRQFHNPGFIPFMQNSMQRFMVPQHQIEVEVTESMAMSGVDEVVKMLTQLKNLGVKIALDDFGTGFSSLSYLQRLPIDRIKIDRAFVMNIHQEKQQRSIAETIVRMSQSLGLEVIAEGVEEQAQSEVLGNLGCPEAQGYLYGKPMDIGNCTEWLISNLKGS